MKKRVGVIGAGLCGFLISALSRDHFQVTVNEQPKKKRPLFTDINCSEGEVTQSRAGSAGRACSGEK